MYQIKNMIFSLHTPYNIRLAKKKKSLSLEISLDAERTTAILGEKAYNESLFFGSSYYIYGALNQFKNFHRKITILYYSLYSPSFPT